MKTWVVSPGGSRRSSGGQFDPADEDAAAAQWQRDASGPDPEFQRRAGPGELG